MMKAYHRHVPFSSVYMPINMRLFYCFTFVLIAKLSSSSCAALTVPGASVRTQLALAVFGNAMVSLRLDRPASSITRRSSPSAIPPCGGTPCSNASRRKPN
ncbi:hypothetical protein C883_3435 [Bacillus stratosphericus LAMA 585]|nr:hypothetical protein C883_3435 [Bacillus stratosphericus LAMA 585]